MFKFSQSFLNFRKEESNSFPTISTLLTDTFNLKDFNKILIEKSIDNIENIKAESLDFLISYAHFILKDYAISENELKDFTFLKRIFRIEEGDFIKNREFDVKEILKKEFLRIYSNNYVNEKEKLLGINLQSLFNLSYDEFEEIKKDDVISSLIMGANPTDLDIAKIPKDFKL